MSEKEKEIYIQLGAEVLMLIFTFLRQAGLTDEQIEQTLVDTRTKFYGVVDKPLPEVPE